MSNKHVLITGYTGSIGAILVEELGGEHKLRGIARNPVEMEGIRGMRGDITDAGSLNEPFEGVDVVIHLAADAHYKGHWPSVRENNIEGTYNVFEAARRQGVRRVIFASSNHVTGYYTEQRIMMDTTMPVAPDGLYGVSKAFGEALGRYYADYHGLSVVSLRIGWIPPSDTPEGALGGRHEEELFRMWLSRRDLVDMVRKCIAAPPDLGHQIFYCMSDNTGSLWDHENARRLVGYHPRDDSAERSERTPWFQGDRGR